LSELNGAHVTVVTECVDGNLGLPDSAHLYELRGNVNHLKCSAGHAFDMSPSEQIEQNDFKCGTCGLPLKPIICLGNTVDDDAVQSALEDIHSLQNVNGVIIVFGACENTVIREAITGMHNNDNVPLYQISSSDILPDANALVVSPRNVLFEIVDELN